MKKYKTHHTKLALSIDLFNSFFLTILFILTILNPSRVPNWESHVLQNLVVLIIYNLLAIPIAACGLLNPIIAVTAMSLSSLSVILNTLFMLKSESNRLHLKKYQLG